ncbi:hypothetical protein [Streptomyces sp. SID13726]
MGEWSARMVTEIVGCAHGELRAGLELEVVFAGGVPRFRPRETAVAV